MKKYLLLLSASSGLFLQSCCGPAAVSGGYGGLPIATTETHTKTMQPASFSMPYMPPASVYQSPPMAVSQPMQAPQCQPMQYMAPPVQYQATPVCPPAPSYQANPCAPVQYQSYQADPCAPQPYNGQMYAPQHVRYNVVGSAQPAQPQYIVVQPSPTSNSQPLQLASPKASDHCE